MSIKETITKVLKQRESRLPKLEKIESGLFSLDNHTSSLQRKTRQVPPEVDVPQEFLRIISSMDIQVKDLQKDIEYIGKSVSDLIKRFSKGTINVGVAGRTGQGKSTLLQKISELPNEIIPASTGYACTGTKSMIYHTEGETRVTIDFYSEEEFLKEVIHFYFDRLGLSPKPTSLEQFEETPLVEFRNDNDREIYNEASYERLSSIRNALPSFKSLLSQGTMTLNRPEDISLYILKHDSHGRELTNHRAVKVANIHTKFPKQDVTGLCLVDLPGLEAAEGFEKKLVTSLEYEVDAVVFIKRPDPLRIDFDEVDYRVIDLINSTVREVELANWLFIILNELDDKSNVSSCEKMKEKLPQEASKLGTSNILISNINDSTQAEKVFSTVLTHLENKLENTDKQFVKALAEKMESVCERLEGTLKSVQDFLGKSQGGSIDREFNKLLIRTFLRPLKERLEDLVVDMAQATSSSFSQEFRKEVNKVCDDIEQSSPTSKESTTREEYEKHLISEYKDKGGWSGAVEEQLNILRADLTSKIAGKLDGYLREKIDNILRDVLSRVFPESLKNLLPSMDEESPHFQVLALRDMIDTEKSPNLYTAFDYVAKFDFSYHSHFHHRVRKEMKRLSSYSTAAVSEIIPPDADETNVKEKSPVIASGLDNVYKATLFQVREKLIGMDEDPGYSVFTLVEDFKDRVIRTKDIEDEWDEFLYPLRAQIWAEKYKAQEEILTLYNGWKDAIDKTLRLARQVKADFAV